MRVAVVPVLIAVCSLALPSAVQARRWRETPLGAPTSAPATPIAMPAANPVAEPAADSTTDPLPPSATLGPTDIPTPSVKATGDYLTRMDADDDGKVSLLEYQDWLSYAFDRMDANRDGTLSPGEQPGGSGAALTRDAHRARVAETFKRQDRNRDGALDTKELAAPPQGK